MKSKDKKTDYAGMKVKSKIKAGGIQLQHNQTIRKG